MSWAAHDLEPYVIQKELGKRVAFVPLLIGSYAPDLATKWFVYGITLAGVELKADNPAQFHRGWPGFGFTHSLTFGVVVGLLLYAIWRNEVVAYSFVIGQWAHALTDVGDTVGTMLFFPFTDHLFAAGAWAYAGQTGRYTDAGERDPVDEPLGSQVGRIGADEERHEGHALSQLFLDDVRLEVVGGPAHLERARSESARADSDRAKIPEGGRFAAAALMSHIGPLVSRRATAGRRTTQTRRKPTQTTHAKRNSGKAAPTATYATPART